MRKSLRNIIFSLTTLGLLGVFNYPLQAQEQTSPKLPLDYGSAVRLSTAIYISGNVGPYTLASALYRVDGKSDIFSIMNGKKHYITNPSAFDHYGYNWAAVVLVNQQFLDKFSDTLLVKSPNSPTIYFIYERPQGQWLKIAIPNPAAFTSYPNNSWGNVVVVDDLDIQAYPDATLIKAQDDSAVYLLQDGQKHLFSSVESFVSHGYEQGMIVTVDRAHLDSYPTGDPII